MWNVSIRSIIEIIFSDNPTNQQQNKRKLFKLLSMDLKHLGFFSEERPISFYKWQEAANTWCALTQK